MLKKIIIIFLFFSSSAFGKEYEDIYIKCSVKECNPKLGDTETRWYKGAKDKPAILWFTGGPSNYKNMELERRPPRYLKGKYDFIIMASPIELKSRKGEPPQAYNKYAVNRVKIVTEYYKNLLKKPIWLGGHSNGGPRVIGAISGKKNNRVADKYAGLIFSSPQLGMRFNELKIRTHKIKYKLNMPVLIINHDRDRGPNTGKVLTKMFYKRFKKKNDGKTELVLLTGGRKSIDDYSDGGHHMFATNNEEYGKALISFIEENTK